MRENIENKHVIWINYKEWVAVKEWEEKLRDDYFKNFWKYIY
jgi:hypothetical protein